MRERLMRSDRASIEAGHLVIRDASGVARWTSNPSEEHRRGDPFDVNGVRLAGIQRLIEHRYRGPCDCDGDVSMYMSAAFNAIALGLQLKRRKASPVHFKNWANQWCPVADQQEVMDLAARVIARPRRIKASTLGRLLGLSSSEHAALSIEAIYPADDDTFEKRKKQEKASRDRAVKERKRREEGCQPLSEIVANSEKAFCRRHGLSARTLRYHKSKGPEALAKYLTRKGISEKLPQDGASTDEDHLLMERRGAASLPEEAVDGPLAGEPQDRILALNINPAELDRSIRHADFERRRAAQKAAARADRGSVAALYQRVSEILAQPGRMKRRAA